MPGAPGVAKELLAGGLEAKEPPKPAFDDPPNVLGPPKLDLAPPREPNPLAEGVAVVEDVDVGDANELSLGAPPKDEAVLGAAPKPPKGDVLLARLPKPEALNLSSEVWARGAVLSDDLGAAGLAAMAAKGEAADVLAKPLPAGIDVAGLAASLSRARLDSRSSPPFAAAWPLVGGSFVLSSAASEASVSSRGRLFFGLVPARDSASVVFAVFLLGEAISASVASMLDAEAGAGAGADLGRAPPSRSVISLERLRACRWGFSEPLSSLSCLLSGCLSPSLSSSTSSRLRFLRNRPRSLSDPEALRLPGCTVPSAASLMCPSAETGCAVASMLVFWNFSRTGLPSLSLLLSLRAGETAAAAAALASVSCCSDELMAAALRVCVLEAGVLGCVLTAGAMGRAVKRQRGVCPVVVAVVVVVPSAVGAATMVLSGAVQGAWYEVARLSGRGAAAATLGDGGRAQRAAVVDAQETNLKVGRAVCESAGVCTADSGVVEEVGGLELG